MALVMVERLFEEPVAYEALQANEDKNAWCLQLHNVRFLRSYFSTDRRRMICVYEAPDAESVRLAQRQMALPFERVWTASPLPSRADAA